MQFKPTLTAASLALALAVGATPLAIAQPLSPNPPANTTSSQTVTATDAMRRDYDAALQRLTAVQQSLRAKYEAGDDYIATRKELEAANKDYETARTKALAKLQKDDKYKQATEGARVASDRVEQARAAAPPTTQPNGTTMIDPKVVDAAQQKLEEKTTASKLEAKALSEDKDYTAAQSRLKDAWAKMNGVRAKYQTELHADQNWQTARADLDRMSAQFHTPATQPSNSTMDAASAGTTYSNNTSVNNANVNDFAGQGQFGGQTGGFNPTADWWLYSAAANAATNANRGVTVIAPESRNRGSASGNTSAGPNMGGANGTTPPGNGVTHTNPRPGGPTVTPGNSTPSNGNSTSGSTAGSTAGSTGGSTAGSTAGSTSGSTAGSTTGNRSTGSNQGTSKTNSSGAQGTP